MKKNIALLFSVLMVTALLAGCAASSAFAVPGNEPTFSASSVDLSEVAKASHVYSNIVGVPATESVRDVISVPEDVYEIAGFDFVFPKEMVGSVEFGFTTSASILAHYYSDEFDGHVDFVRFLNENNAYDSIRGDFYYCEHEAVSVDGVEVNVLSNGTKKDGSKEKIIAYWKIDEWCYKMNAHFAPDCDFDTILERFVLISLNQT